MKLREREGQRVNSGRSFIDYRLSIFDIYFGFDRYHTDIVMVGRNFEKVFFEVYLFNGKKSILTAKLPSRFTHS